MDRPGEVELELDQTLLGRSRIEAGETRDDNAKPGPNERPVTEFEPGQRFAHFELGEVLGRGGMGTVVAAHDRRLDRRVALKFLTRAGQDEVARERLLREARSLARLSHPNVVAVYEVGEAKGMPFLAMELVEGQSLREWLRADEEPADQAEDASPSPPPTRLEILDMFLAIGRALAAAHDLGIVHRDFKPDNVLVGSDGRPRVVDFGLARLGLAQGFDSPAPRPASSASLEGSPGGSLTRTGTLLGTPAYMAPEQWIGLPIDARSDQFSFCVALFHALYGQPPFSGDSMEKLQDAVCDHEPLPIARSDRVPDDLHAAILKGMSKDPDERWPAMEPLLEAIEGALARVQPGLFSTRPTLFLRLLLPLFWATPLVWFVLERLAVVTYAAHSWALVSGAQLLAIMAVVLALRNVIVEQLGDRRIIGMPVLLAFFVLAHRALALTSETSLAAMFAYDFVAIAGVGLVVAFLIERRLWPIALFNAALAVIATIRPEWAPHLWVAFSIGMPVLAVLSLSRGTRELRGGTTSIRSSSRSRRSSRSGLRSGADLDLG